MENSVDKVFEFNSNKYEVLRTGVRIDSVEKNAVKWKYFSCALLINVRKIIFLKTQLILSSN